MDTLGAAAEAGRAVERWPRSVYPAPKIRGLHGGSLWLTFHGLQWPYAPQLTGDPETRFGLSGYVWIDTGLKHVGSTNEALRSELRFLQEGRLVLRGTPTYSAGDWFVQGQGELIAAKDQRASPRVDADDVWVRAGRWNVFDVQVGRFEAWEVYHYGMGLDLYTSEREGAVLDGPPANVPPSIYGATFLWERPAEAGNVAGHIYALDILRFEVLGQLGNAGMNTLGVRPAAVLDLGWLKAKAAGEYRRRSFQSDAIDTATIQKGLAASVQMIFDPLVEFGVNGGFGTHTEFDTDGVRDDVSSTTRFSGGAFVNGRPLPNVLVGAGGHYTRWVNIAEDAKGRVGEFDHIQAFVAGQYLFLDQLFLKLVLGYANALTAPSFTDDSHTNTMLSARIRAMYLF